MKLGFSQRIFEKIFKFEENLSSGSRVVPCGQTDKRMDRQTWRSQWSLFAILRICKKNDNLHEYVILERIEKYFITEYFQKLLCRCVLSEDKFRNISTRQCEGTKPTKVERVCVKSWNFRGDSKFCSTIWTANAQQKWKGFIFILMWIFVTENVIYGTFVFPFLWLYWYRHNTIKSTLRSPWLNSGESVLMV